MSTESHNPDQEPRHTDVSFEERDIKASTIYGYLFSLGLAVVVSALICVYILRFTLNYAASTDTPPPPSREALGKDYRMVPPEPRLQGVPGHQTDPQADLRKKNQEDSEANEKLEWIDRSSGVAQIPVKDAMKIVADRGLSAPPAPVVEKKN
jgi:hypothetical protein